MNLKIPENLSGPKTVVSLVKSLRNKFEPTQAKSLEKAIELGCCIQVMCDRYSFVDYMESFIFDIQHDERSYAWGYKCDGLGLLAYDADSHSDTELRARAVSVMASRHFDTDDLSWLIENARDELDHECEEEEILAALAEQGKSLDLTPKEKQQGCCSRLVILTYYHQLLKAFKEESATEEIESLAKLIEQYRAMLKSSLATS
ncbi:hypothetical protein [Marinobacter alexandrii]|uniref:hypothetical protein n=1 Tax=Marinobacter alexandrii TaxID=2570351 RepID=UPI001107B743|nr:hypothetical protein [Marinobacter alexandrii]